MTPVFAELLMVVMTAVMAASVFFMWSGVANEAPTIPTRIVLGDARQVPANAPGYCCLNDTLLEVVSAFGDARAWDSGLEFQIIDAATGALIMRGDLQPAPADPSKYYVGVYHGSPSEASIVNVGYVDLDGNSFASAPDHIEVRGMSKEYHQATFRILGGTATLASQMLP